jgi:hypothetical protein
MRAFPPKYSTLYIAWSPLTDPRYITNFRIWGNSAGLIMNGCESAQILAGLLVAYKNNHVGNQNPIRT